MESKEYKEGRAARRNKLPRSSCPYCLWDLREEWENGWEYEYYIDEVMDKY